MRLFEFEGKRLLKDGGMRVPRSAVLSGHAADTIPSGNVLCKAQLPFGDRMKKGGIAASSGIEETRANVKTLLEKEFDGVRPSAVLVEEKIAYEGTEHYISFVCDARSRSVLFTYSSEGGTGIEGRKTTSSTIDILDPQFPDIPVPREVTMKLFDIFRANDCILLEVNPLVRAQDGEWIALDARIELDDAAMSRHPERDLSDHPSSTESGCTLSERERRAKEIDANDHRGTAGSVYVELPGDIGVLPSGGGASLTAIDALVRHGGAPANYTEYSGNPTSEKVKKLVSVVVSKPDLRALWVVGAVANFTDIYETMKGFIEGLRYARKEYALPIDYPIVIRRGGPRDEEAFRALRDVKDFDLHITGEETSIEESARLVRELADEYARR